MIQQGTEQATPQPTTQPAAPAPQPAAPAPQPVAPQEPQPATLHDFTLDLLTDAAAREAFQLDPEGVLHACGLGDITPGDVQEILPLVLDAASVGNVDAVGQVLGATGDLGVVDQLTAIAGNAAGVGSIADAVAVPSLVDDFSGLGDVSGTLDSSVLGTDAVSTVTGLVHGTDAVSTVTGVVDGTDAVSTATGLVHGVDAVNTVTNVVDVHGVSGSLVSDLDANTLVKDVVDTDALVKDVVDTDVLVKDTADVTHNVVQNVAQVGDVHHDLGQVVGDVKIGDIDVLDHVGNGNVLDVLHH
jgi:hypothetical protein